MTVELIIFHCCRITPCNFTHTRYNRQRMKSYVLALLLSFSLLAPTVLAESNEATQNESPELTKLKEELNQVSRDILLSSQTLWLLLSKINDKKKADASAAAFRKLTNELIELDLKLSALENQAPEALHTELNRNIIESYRNIDTEFGSLYRVRCFGSGPLYQAFEEAIGSNFFDTTMLPPNHPVLPKLDEAEEKIELTRLKKLITPDTAILHHLMQIEDSKSAGKHCQAMLPHLKKLNTLQADNKYLYRDFKNTAKKDFRETQRSLQDLLWSMRTEYVRIAAIPLDPVEDSHELLAHTLDELYFSLEVTHHYWFSLVFDNSFILDMDEAFRESELEFIRQSTN